ncbi:alpha/beta fold hydrolase [Salipaludibacillus aurantiacus]|uniref:3-oxoadipate enol-lactonase n=1 Tax=Salipaludibacillus aurantiacus TaxID=1601833 RepID=A0A1H9SMU5_9BACI|nr:alpha/beta hydrolase [Salipaludibacillus aurantiacus]SER85703.1 3-oxoadipate enol-lactonase [Salipaludibacillus aurantiacus]
MIRVNGVRLNLKFYGEGEPVILLHGLGGSLEGMATLAKGLMDKYRVIAYDCRGHGRSEKPAVYSLEDHAKDLIGLVDYFGYEKVKAVGFSMGSYITMNAAAIHPDRFEKMVLIAPKIKGDMSSVERLLNEQGLNALTASPLQRYLVLRKAAFSPDTSFVKKLKLMCLAGSSKLTRCQSSAAAEALRGFDLRQRLSDITVKTLVCSGKHDGINPPSDGEETAALLPEAQFVLFKNSGHHIIIEEEKRCLTIIRKFFEGRTLPFSGEVPE